jgi:Ca-activated chloride channel family protein
MLLARRLSSRTIVRSAAVFIAAGSCGIVPLRLIQAEGQPLGSVPPATAPAPAPALGQEDPFKHKAPTKEELDKLVASGFAATVRVDRVIVPVVVTDKKGRPISGLQLKDFQLMENRVPQKIDYFQAEQAQHVSIAFLLDVSGSMRLLDKIGESREAIRYFVEGLQAHDQAAVMTFADGEVDTLAPFGTNRATILARLDLVKGYGQTALNDAIAAAPGIVQEEPNGRKAIVLITDGIDNASKLSLFEAMSAARRVDVPIYAIGFASSTSISDKPGVTPPPPDAGTNAEVLKLIANETGGNFFWIDDPDDLKEAIRTIEEELRSEYVLGYTPPQTACDGSFRQIDLKLSKNRYRIRTRKGYVSGPC